MPPWYRGVPLQLHVVLPELIHAIWKSHLDPLAPRQHVLLCLSRHGLVVDVATDKGIARWTRADAGVAVIQRGCDLCIGDVGIHQEELLGCSSLQVDVLIRRNGYVVTAIGDLQILPNARPVTIADHPLAVVDEPVLVYPVVNSEVDVLVTNGVATQVLQTLGELGAEKLLPVGQVKPMGEALAALAFPHNVRRPVLAFRALWHDLRLRCG
mmetsp:Transcript_65352/g.144566  ORF Transcript_65352/g.144566 Transcript_65352/m.144566 type:complete len:211 (+) Transcript_65352:531-1163(+)